MGLRDDMANREGGKENAWARLRHLARVAKLAPNAPGDKRRRVFHGRSVDVRGVPFSVAVRPGHSVVRIPTSSRCRSRSAGS